MLTKRLLAVDLVLSGDDLTNSIHRWRANQNLQVRREELARGTESYAVGTPVAYVRGTAVEEVLGPGVPGGFALQDPDPLAQVIGLTPNQVQAKRDELLDRFSWAECARRTIVAYGEFL